MEQMNKYYTKNEEIKYIDITKHYKKLLRRCYEKKQKHHNPILPQIPDDPYRILIIGGSGFGKMHHSI